MNKDINGKISENKSKKKLACADIIVVGVILLLVVILLLMGQRACKVVLPAQLEDGATWLEIWNDGTVVACADQGYASETEYVFNYRSVSTQGKTIVIFAYVDGETGDEMAERVAYEFSSNMLGFLTAVQIDIPEDLEDVTLPPMETESDTEAFAGPSAEDALSE